MSSLGRVKSTDASLSKKFQESQSVQLRFQQKCEEFNVKPVLFTYNELRVATRNFHPDTILADSSFGVMYKGVLLNGNVVALKRDSLTSQWAIDKFLNEVVISTRLKHKNLVTLKGCCLHDQQCLLVYEYMENSDLCFLLEQGPDRQMVSWPVRLKICLGVAQGLHYLHAVAHPKIVHRNIKPSNVLLDRNFDPKIGGFSLAYLFPKDQSHIWVTHIAGTKGSIAPEYLYGDLSDKVDVYSFGVLCLEIISGRRGIDYSAPSDRQYLPRWASRLHEEEKLLDLVDPTLHLTDAEVGEVQQVIKLCLMCIQDEADMRPSMARIVSILQEDTE